MTISRKLSLLFSGVVAAFALLAMALMVQLRWQAASFDAVLNMPVRQMEAARIVQVDFKKQVQEWKDILLRGHNADDLAHYSQNFHEKEAAVHAGAEALKQGVTDPEARRLLEEFLAAHSALSQKYAEAYAAYVAGNADFKAADAIVRGQDRAPTDLFDAVVARLEVVMKNALAEQRAGSIRSRNRAVAATGMILLLVAVLGSLVVRDIIARLGRLKQASDRLARADLSGLTIDVAGSDEIAGFARSMRGVHAAIEELLAAASAQSQAHAAGRGN